MQQQLLAEAPFQKVSPASRLERLLDQMAHVIPWDGLAGVIAPYDPKTAGAGRPLVSLHPQDWMNP